MKIKKTWFWTLFLTFFACFLLNSYWTIGESLIKTLYIALQPFIVGAMMAFIINIVLSAYEFIYDKLLISQKLQNWKRPICLSLSYLSFILVIVTIVSVVIPDLITSIASLVSTLPSNLQSVINQLSKNETTARLLNQLLERVGSEEEVINNTSQYAQEILTQVLSSLNAVISSIGSIASSLVNVFVSLIFSVYVLANKEKLARQSTLLINTYLNKLQDTIYFVLNVVNTNFKNFFVGQTIEAIILGTLTALGMLALQIPYASTIAILVGFTALIPVVGAYIGLVVGVVMISTQSFSQAILFVIFLVILQQIEGNLIYPKVVGNSVSLPGMWVLLAITVGGALYGVFGMLIAVPIFATLYQLIRYDVYRKQGL